MSSHGQCRGSVENRFLFEGRDSFSDYQLRSDGSPVVAGRVTAALPFLPGPFESYQCRNHSIAYAAFLLIEDEIEALKRKYSCERVGVVVGSSTSGTEATEKAFYHWKEKGNVPASFFYEKQHELGSVSSIISGLAGSKGPAYTVSTACSSSAKSFASARGLIRAGICDAVITGGFDTLCGLTIEGFRSLGLLSAKRCNPMSKNRDGLNIGEGGALFILCRDESAISLKGIGESSDAHHISSPCPDGSGAVLAMQRSLDDARLLPQEIGYVNLHGTGTVSNDAAEARAVSTLFGERTPCSSTKPLTGHCLGAAGAIEIAMCCLAVISEKDGAFALPPHCWDGTADDDLPPINLGERDTPGPGGRLNCLSNSFAFGGSNCSVIVGSTL